MPDIIQFWTIPSTWPAVLLLAGGQGVGEAPTHCLSLPESLGVSPTPCRIKHLRCNPTVNHGCATVRHCWATVDRPLDDRHYAGAGRVMKSAIISGLIC